ncbi:hypothetical protein AB434_1247 [Heyndrickxia coagulans]|uniref:Uncharacterized protein n=1 Tax=Heyndrickxia coagulans TaxID=1398 RepID=A0AAN0T998_HEYCO|nr:hypothetical protein SB48_HM08orf06498 [Heyndrickxia coagulans]AKN53652.1 hypothetical protein AB434_1247 [Heyndrickxia coagulans]KYC86238.1 hypothetical protein B4096_1230 [Heyndrickxia coagulans]
MATEVSSKMVQRSRAAVNGNLSFAGTNITGVSLQNRDKPCGLGPALLLEPF